MNYKPRKKNEQHYIDSECDVNLNSSYNKNRLNEAPQAVDKSKYTNIDFRDGVVGSSAPSRDKINPSLLADVDKAAGIAGTKGSVTTAVTGHRTGSRHNPSGNAVDLAMFDGKGYHSIDDAKKKGIYDKIANFVKALESMGYKVNSERGNDKAVLWFGFKNHHHHVHVSRLSDDGQSTAKETDKSKTPAVNKNTNDKTKKMPSVILMGGLNYRKGDKSTIEQGELVSSGLGGITNVIAKDYNDLAGVKKEIDKSPNSPIVLFSAGGGYASQIAKYVKEKGGDPTNIFISEPYTCSSNTKVSVETAISNGVPKENIIGGEDTCTGSNVAGVSRKEKGGKSHWDGLKVAGQLVKEKLGSLSNDTSSETQTNTSDTSSSSETQTNTSDTSSNNNKDDGFRSKLFNIFSKLEEGKNNKLNEEVSRINDLIKKIL